MSGDNRILLGQGTTARGGTSKYGLWVSKPTKNVLTCTDDELIFDMDKGGSADIKGMFQLQTVTGTATASTTTTVSANTTTNISFTNFNWGFGIVPIMGTGIATVEGNVQYTGGFTINSFTTSAVNVTNLSSSASLNVSLSVMPFFSSNARF
tara:strand:- start:3885 stop:4340 length:456 start_codon:yes stop_codon:yes gene_type:complete